jgi:hypothetical protein
MRSIPTLLLLCLLPMACAHSMMRGSVVMKVDTDEAHACLGENEVKTGDKLSL